MSEKGAVWLNCVSASTIHVTVVKSARDPACATRNAGMCATWQTVHVAKEPGPWECHSAPPLATNRTAAMAAVSAATCSHRSGLWRLLIPKTAFTLKFPLWFAILAQLGPEGAFATAHGRGDCRSMRVMNLRRAAPALHEHMQ